MAAHRLPRSWRLKYLFIKSLSEPTSIVQKLILRLSSDEFFKLILFDKNLIAYINLT